MSAWRNHYFQPSTRTFPDLICRMCPTPACDFLYIYQMDVLAKIIWWKKLRSSVHNFFAIDTPEWQAVTVSCFSDEIVRLEYYKSTLFYFDCSVASVFLNITDVWIGFSQYWFNHSLPVALILFLTYLQTDWYFRRVSKSSKIIVLFNLIGSANVSQKFPLCICKRLNEKTPFG